MRFFKALFLLVMFVVAMLFFVQNIQTLNTEITLVLNVFVAHWQTVPLPLYWLVLLPFALGCLLMIVYFGLEKLRMSQDLRAARAQTAQLQKELAAMRPVSPTGDPEPEVCCQPGQ